MTIEEFAADGYTHVECFCRKSRWGLSISLLAGYSAPSAAVRCSLQAVAPGRWAGLVQWGAMPDAEDLILYTRLTGLDLAFT